MNSSFFCSVLTLAKESAYISHTQGCCDIGPEEPSPNQEQFKRLFEYLKSGKFEVRVLPKVSFGLAHGKAGVIKMADEKEQIFQWVEDELRACMGR